MREQERRKAAWRYLAAAVRGQGRAVVAAIGAGLSWQLAAVLAPLLVGKAIDDGIRGGDTGRLYLWSGLLLALGSVEVVSWGFRHFLAVRNGTRAEAGVRDGIFAHVLVLDARFHDRHGPGDLLSRASSDSEYIRRVVDALGHTSAYLLTVVAAAALMLWTDVGLALIVLLPLLPLSLAMWRYSIRYAGPSTRLQEGLAETAGLVEEAVTGVRVVKGLGAGGALLARFRRTSDEVVQRALAVARVEAVFFPLLEALPLLGLVAVLWFGGGRVLEGELTVGEFTRFYLYVVLLVWPLRTLGQRISTLQRALAAAARVVDVHAASPAIVERPRAVPLRSRPRGDVRFRDVRFSYDGGAQVLDGLDLHVPAGTSLALVGPTGSGKSTVAGLLVRFYDVDGGAVELDGVDVRELRLTDLRRTVSLVFEETFLFTDSVRANIAFARPAATDEEIVRAARLAGAHEFIQELPGGYRTLLGERGFSLSGGQRQRIAIARAVLADPSVLVLDDATSAVDAAMEHEIRSALQTVMANRTTLVIAHRPATVALADRVALLDRGRTVALGTHAELLAGEPRYRDVLAADDEEERPA